MPKPGTFPLLSAKKCDLCIIKLNNSFFVEHLLIATIKLAPSDRRRTGDDERLTNSSFLFCRKYRGGATPST